MSCLVAFIYGKASGFSENDDTLYRFGYMVGLVETYIPSAGKNQECFNKFMATLVFKTSIVKRKSIDSLLENYQHIVKQGLFRKGSTRGRDDACKVDLPVDVAKSLSQEALSD